MFRTSLMLKNILNLKKFNNNMIKISKKNKFLRTERPWLNTQDNDELPDKYQDIGTRLDSSRTYTKWFNPNSFDPRTPDYYDTVRTTWQEDVTREDFGNGKKNIFIII
jgi:hypothetical protein